MKKAPIFWITGIPASGKTTLARHLVRHFREQGIPADIVDGDDIRRYISPELGFSKADRLFNQKRIAWISRLLARNGVTAVVASVSPYIEGREAARGQAKAEGLQFIEIFLSCSLTIARGRDVKNLYAKTDVTGAGAPYEAPEKPDIRIETDHLDQDEVLHAALKALIKDETAERG